METPNIIAATLERKLSLEGSESEILVDAEPKEQKIAAEASDSGDDIAVPPSPTAVPSAAAPSTGWFDWLPSLGFLSPSDPTPVSEEQRQQQIQQRQALEASVFSAQEGSDDDFVSVDSPIEAHLLPKQELKIQEEATRALEAQQLQQAQELKAQEEAARALEEEQLRQEQELKTQQEATATDSSSIWNLYGYLGSSSPASPAQTEQEAAAIVPDSASANASNTTTPEPTPNILANDSYLSYIFSPTPSSLAAPGDPHPGEALPLADAISQVLNDSSDTLDSKETAEQPTTGDETTSDSEQLSTDETAQPTQPAHVDVTIWLAQEQLKLEAERLRIEAELQAARVRLQLEQTQQRATMLLQQQCEATRRRLAEQAVQIAAERKEAEARAAFASSCSTGAPTIEEHRKILRAAIIAGGF